jgi:hypothetical protein
VMPADGPRPRHAHRRLPCPPWFIAAAWNLAFGVFGPLLTQVISEGVAEGIFDTFDPEGVGDMIQALALRTNSPILDVVRAADQSERRRAIGVLTARFRLHGLAVDRILGLPDASVTVLTRAQVKKMVAALPRNY